MEYSIQELSRLSGVTTRTLRWYDQIGLLKPSRVAESGYRYYGPAEVDRLQDILYYRALGVELARIRECLDDPAFDRLAALQSHLAALEAERTRLDALIQEPGHQAAHGGRRRCPHRHHPDSSAVRSAVHHLMFLQTRRGLSLCSGSPRKGGDLP